MSKAHAFYVQNNERTTTYVTQQKNNDNHWITDFTECGRLNKFEGASSPLNVDIGLTKNYKNQLKKALFIMDKMWYVFFS